MEDTKAVCLKGGNNSFTKGKEYDVIFTGLEGHVTLHSEHFVYQGQMCDNGLIKVHGTQIYLFKLVK